jgi:hypothetical protein
MRGREARKKRAACPRDDVKTGVFDVSGGVAVRNSGRELASARKRLKYGTSEAINRSSKKVKQTPAVSIRRFGQQPGPDDPPPIECS